MSQDPVKCDRCGSKLDGGYCARWQCPEGGEAKLIEAICFKCDECEAVYQYTKDKVLTSRLTMNAAMFALQHEVRVIVTNA